MRAHLVFIIVGLTIAPCYAAKPIDRDGSTIEKAIPLKQRGAKAIDEEMQWMMKSLHCTPLLASRDVLVEAARKAVETKKAVHPPMPWQHATLEHGPQLCSYWMVRTPRGERHIYFDTGIPIDTPGAVQQMESSRAQYMDRLLKSLKIP